MWNAAKSFAALAPSGMCGVICDPPRGPGEPGSLAEAVRRVIRARHMSPRTEKAYLGWIRRFLEFNRRRHPTDLGKTEIEAFLSHLATHRKVSASTQNQALSALLFLYREVYGWEFPWLARLSHQACATARRTPLVHRSCGGRPTRPPLTVRSRRGIVVAVRWVRFPAGSGQDENASRPSMGR